MLFGSLVVVTGPTVIGPLVNELRLKRRVATVLEAEGVLIDPIGAHPRGAVLALALVSRRCDRRRSAASICCSGWASASGTGGAVAAAARRPLLRVQRLIPEGLENIFVLAVGAAALRRAARR